MLFDVRRSGEKLCSLNSSINQVNTAAKKTHKTRGIKLDFITSLCSDSPYELLISFYRHRGLEYDVGEDVLICKEGERFHTGGTGGGW